MGAYLLAPSRPCLGLRFHDLRNSHKTLLTELGVPEVLQHERIGNHPPGMRTAKLEGLERTWQHTGPQPHIGLRLDP
jgi:hypothetical protein